MNLATQHPIPAGIGEEEWRIRCDLAALYRLVAHHRMTDLIYTHISARLPGPEHRFLINSYGVMFHEMRASDLVKIDLHGNILEPEGRSGLNLNQAGFTIHSAVHMGREDVMCVVHTHTAAGIAVSAQEHGLLPISQHALKFYGHLGYHGYEGVAIDLDERHRLVADLGPHKAMILRNHGLLVAGATVPEAWHLIYFLERACQAQVAALAGGAKLVLPPEEVCRKTARQTGPTDPTRRHIQMAWDASLRLLADDRVPYWS
jgi:ribulose-5-phosphate 4-epimerase/fuculose-1-phosphate aldolase